MASIIREIVIDCVNPQTVSRFWGSVLGWKIHEEGSLCWMSASGADEVRDLALVFIPVPEAKIVKNRLHIDVLPSGCDWEEELGRLKALGAVEVDVGQVDRPWVVLADPEGNEFCLLSGRAG